MGWAGPHGCTPGGPAALNSGVSPLLLRWARASPPMGTVHHPLPQPLDELPWRPWMMVLMTAAGEQPMDLMFMGGAVAVAGTVGEREREREREAG